MFDVVLDLQMLHILPTFTYAASWQIATFQVDNRRLVNRIMQLDGVWGKSESS